MAQRKLKVTNQRGVVQYAPIANLSGLLKKNRYAKEKDRFTVEEVRIDGDTEEILKVHAQSAASELKKALTEKDEQIAELQRQLALAQKKKVPGPAAQTTQPPAPPAMSDNEKVIALIKELLNKDTSWKDITAQVNKQFKTSHKAKDLQKLL